MSNFDLDTATKIRPQIYSFVSVPRTQEEYDRAVALLDELIDEVGENEQQPLASLMDTLGTLIEAYEDANLPGTMRNPGSLSLFK